MPPRSWRSRAARVLNPREPDIDLPGPSPFTFDETARSLREDAAQIMMDPDTYGYVLLVLKRKPSLKGQIDLYARVERRWLVAFGKALRKVGDAFY